MVSLDLFGLGPLNSPPGDGPPRAKPLFCHPALKLLWIFKLKLISPSFNIARSSRCGRAIKSDDSTPRPSYEPSEEDAEPATVSAPTSSIRPYLIIHPEYVSPTGVSSRIGNDSNAFHQPKPSKSADNNDNSTDPSELANANESNDLSPTTTSSNKVIKIYFPASNKLPSQQANTSQESASSTIVGKRTSIDQSDHSNNNSNHNPLAQGTFSLSSLPPAHSLPPAPAL